MSLNLFLHGAEWFLYPQPHLRERSVAKITGRALVLVKPTQAAGKEAFF